MPLPRPVLVVDPAPTMIGALRIAAVRRLAAVHARATGGRSLRPVVSVLDRLLPPSPLPDVRARLAPGTELRLDGAGALARIALLCDGYEHGECETLAGAVGDGGVFVDVGANVGWFSLMVAAHRPGGVVWAVEPVPATARELRANVAASGLGSVVVHEVALGAEEGSAELVEPADPAFAHLAGVGASRSPSGRAVRAGTPTAGCAVTTLDQLWSRAGRPRVDAVKVDVEGAEPDVLRGATDLLGTCGPVLVVEAPTTPEAAAVHAVLEPLGYRRVARAGLLPYNLVFVREESW